MKHICICQPIIPDSGLPIAIHPTGETRVWRQKQFFKMFFEQHKIDKRQYQVVLLKNFEKVRKFSAKKRCETALRRLAIKHSYMVKGPNNVWLYLTTSSKQKKKKLDSLFEVYPLEDSTLVKLVTSIIIDSTKQYMYTVVAQHLHELGYPTPNVNTRKLYMRILFKHLQRVVNALAEQTLQFAKKNKRPFSDNFFRYLDINCRFWESTKAVHTICGRMTDLRSTKLYVQAVLPDHL